MQRSEQNDQFVVMRSNCILFARSALIKDARVIDKTFCYGLLHYEVWCT